MNAIKVTTGMFAASGQLYGKNGLDEIIRRMAIDNARLKVETASIPDLTDNTTGVAGATLVDLLDHPTIFDASSTGGVTNTALITAIGKATDVQKVFSVTVNAARVLLGLDSVSAPDGNQAAANTLPAMDKAVAAGNGNAVPTLASVVGSLKVLKSNQRKLVRSVQEVLVAAGQPSLKGAFKGPVTSDFTLDAKPTPIVSSDGKMSAAKTDVDAFFTGLANNYATLAAAWNAGMTQSSAAMPLGVIAG